MRTGHEAIVPVTADPAPREEREQLAAVIRLCRELEVAAGWQNLDDIFEIVEELSKYY